MKKIFILLAACTMGVAYNASAMTTESSTAAHYMDGDVLTLDQVQDEIDDLCEILDSGLDLGDDMIELIAGGIADDIMSLEGLDRVNALGYYYVSMNELDSSAGFSSARRDELHKIVAEWTVRLVDADNLEAEHAKYEKMCRGLDDDEVTYLNEALPVFVETYINM